MQNIKLFIIIVITIVLTACSTAGISANYGVEPFVKYPFPPQSKILVVSAVNDNFILKRGFSTNYFHLNGGNLDGIILQSVAQTLRSKHYQVVTTSWANSQLVDVDTESSVIRPAFQSIITGSTSLNPEVVSQLHSLNARYNADYILLITGHGNLFCTAIGNLASPSLNMQMYLIDARSNNMVARLGKSAQGSNQYSVSDNLQLCQEIGIDQPETPHEQILKQWLRAQAPQLAHQTTQELLMVASFR